ncbi:unnamed protein product [Diatraea saccharalis]|uniref:Uncharacterized protein n=1 Tax=Diatraea saccharalis TaxID=40085 RepID=A0A9N9RAL7_9NEOP|nr:unnamed protein product [Diatraea saccharalis]
MFWADWHQGPVIMWANMDGSQPAVLVDSLVGYATGLAMDSPNGRLYYVDHTVKVIKIDDMQFYSLFDEQYHHPYSIAVFENTVYWSDWTSNSIQTTDKLHSTARKRNVLVKKDTPIYGMEHYNPIFIVIGGGSYFTHIEMNVLGNPEAHAIHFDIGRVQAMAYDSKREFKTGVTNLFLYRGLDDVVEMDYDDATDSLYILDQGRNAIDVVSLRTHKRALIHRLESHEVPLSFCVMSEYG